MTDFILEPDSFPEDIACEPLPQSIAGHLNYDRFSVEELMREVDSKFKKWSRRRGVSYGFDTTSFRYGK